MTSTRMLMATESSVSLNDFPLQQPRDASKTPAGYLKGISCSSQVGFSQWLYNDGRNYWFRLSL
jgi:hypothetical protein